MMWSSILFLACKIFISSQFFKAGWNDCHCDNMIFNVIFWWKYYIDSHKIPLILMDKAGDTLRCILNINLVFWWKYLNVYLYVFPYWQGWCSSDILMFSCMVINSSPPSDACMHQWTGSAMVQVMTCRLFGVKPLPEPMLIYCQLDPLEQISVKF